MEIEILDSSGAVINTIIADADFADEFYPNSWREKAKPEPEPEPIPQPITLDEAKAAKVVEIKAEAERSITALDWRLQRAQEREQLGEEGFETVTDVLALREQIRKASNAAEQAVSTLTDVGAVLVFTW
ncbi:hypothetical protein [Aeromonas veronii]|uniref:hypothetical protein n=1 Tax=Aeromonas veronii TaxID=654 RepID=UPI0022457BF2|nr:hypothetical protein [Aeromonas veronii]MCX0428860.1 hypothetical protein [Aeromonas veronii]MCX0448369.1 hypothetical protein [Aeromonas veronii]